MRFWDASALVPLCAQEAGTPLVRVLQEQDPDIVAWWGSPIECLSALRRVIRMGQLDEAGAVAPRACLNSLWRTVVQVAPTEQVRTRAARLLAAYPLRAADAFQLGAALVWAQDRAADHEFVCLDDRLREAARQEGFSVLP